MSNALRRIHPVAGVVGTLTILTFWTSTVLVEVFGSHQAIATVKTGILWGMIVLIPALAITGATGFKLAGPLSKGAVGAKKRRMPVIAGNGILILIPCAVYLQGLAAAGDFGTTFYAVQAVELVAGALNVTLMALNIRDGFRMTRGRRAANAAA